MAQKLSTTIRNAGLGHLLQKPLFVTKDDEKHLLEMLEKKDYTGFYDYGAKIIKSSDDVRNLYIHIKSKLEDKGILDDLIDEKSKLILEDTTFGFLEVKNPVLENYLGNKTKKKDLGFFEEYKKFFEIENKIRNNLDFLESEILDYYNFLEKSLSRKEIDEQQYHTAYELLVTSFIVTRQNGQVLGSLVSEELQKQLGFKSIYPKIKVDAD